MSNTSPWQQNWSFPNNNKTMQKTRIHPPYEKWSICIHDDGVRVAVDFLKWSQICSRWISGSRFAKLIFNVLLRAKNPPETTHVSSQASKVSKLLAFPPQPPYSNSSQRPVSTLKKKRSLMALQCPGSSFRAHSSLKMKSSGSAPSKRGG